MRTTIALALVLCWSAPLFASDQDRPPNSPRHRISQPLAPDKEAGWLLRSAPADSSGVAVFPDVSAQEPAVSVQPHKPRSWISRHPAMFGALVGAGAGAVASATMENELFCSGGDEDCFFHGGGRLLVGAGIGAGVGALIGWIGSH